MAYFARNGGKDAHAVLTAGGPQRTRLCRNSEGTEGRSTPAFQALPFPARAGGNAPAGGLYPARKGAVPGRAAARRRSCEWRTGVGIRWDSLVEREIRQKGAAAGKPLRRLLSTDRPFRNGLFFRRYSASRASRSSIMESHSFSSCPPVTGSPTKWPSLSRKTVVGMYSKATSSSIAGWNFQIG